ncbi:MAG: hypothetical protein ACXVZV_09685, partial [Terriglobales bacterium]
RVYCQTAEIYISFVTNRLGGDCGISMLDKIFTEREKQFRVSGFELRVWDQDIRTTPLEPTKASVGHAVAVLRTALERFILHCNPRLRFGLKNVRPPLRSGPSHKLWQPFLTARHVIGAT